MILWIDGDACPNPIKQILFRAAITRKIQLIMVANHLATTPPSPYIKKILVEPGFDAADNYIVQHVKANDLVITSDIILADHCITKSAIVLTPRGMHYSEHNIKQALTLRNLNESLRSSGLIQGGTNSLTSKDIRLFSNHLDKLITKWLNM